MASSRTIGLIYGTIGMVSFSLTLPATRAAVLALHPAVVAFGRPLVAGVLAAGLLMAMRVRPPSRRYWKKFAVVVVGLVVGVPLTFSWGMFALPASHGAITLGLLPLVTALVGAMFAGERPSARFWTASVIGSAAVLLYARASGAGRIQSGDIILIVSVIASAVGYAEGSRLARVYPGWQVMSWALVFGLPIHVIPFALAVHAHGFAGTPRAYAGFAYIAVVSQWLGLFAWFKGMAAGGIARIGQLQLLQPFCTLLFAAVWLHERLTVGMLIAAGVVVFSVALSRSAVVRYSEEGEP